jgi:hypothetical protein
MSLSAVFTLGNSLAVESDGKRAGDRTRTGDIFLGREELYQLSYAREW